LADIAITDPKTFTAIVATAKAALPADTSAPKVTAA
ncbi:MAG: 50S ribosomal protein L20, partial [Glaciihabitans sp.]